MQIGQNKTRYNSEDLQGLLDLTKRKADEWGMGCRFLRDPPWKGPLNVATLSPKGLLKLRHDQMVAPEEVAALVGGYAFSSPAKLHLMSPAGLRAAHPPLEALSLPFDTFLPVSAQNQAVMVMLAYLNRGSRREPRQAGGWDGVRDGVRQRTWKFVVEDSEVKGFKVRVMARIQCQTPRTPEEKERADRLKVLYKRYHEAEMRTALTDSERNTSGWLRRYEYTANKLNGIGRRIQEMGGFVELHPPVRELLESLLAEHQEEEEE